MRLEKVHKQLLAICEYKAKELENIEILIFVLTRISDTVMLNELVSRVFNDSYGGSWYIYIYIYIYLICTYMYNRIGRKLRHIALYTEEKLLLDYIQRGPVILNNLLKMKSN